MATAGWRSDRSLKESLRAEPAQFDWFQLVRLLLYERGRKDAPAMLDRHIRFRGDLSFSFPAHEITAVTDVAPQKPITVMTRNYTVAGYLGPLPESITESLYERRSGHSNSFKDFLDIFNHRLGSARYRLKSRIYPALVRVHPEQTPLAARLAAVMGLPPGQPVDQLPLPLRALLGVAGLLANRRRNIDTLARILSTYLGVKVVVIPLRGGWKPIELEDQARLGQSNHVLGRNAVIGHRVWDAAAAVEIRIGPLGAARFRDLLPGGSHHCNLVALLRFLTNRQVDTWIRLIAHAPDVPGVRLGGRTDPSQLGLTSWVGDRSDGERDARFMVPAFAQEVASAA